jgi:hypothetical protein
MRLAVLHPIDRGRLPGDGRRMRASQYITRWIILVAVGSCFGLGGAYAFARPPVQRVVTEVAGSSVVTLRLDVAVGHGDETRRTAGQSAAVACWLRRGPSQEVDFSEFEVSVQRWGMSLTTELGWRTTSLVLTGPAKRAGRIGRLLADRLSPVMLGSLGVEALQDAVWLDAERSLQGVVGPMGNALGSSVSAVEGGRTAFSSRVAASRLEPEAFRRLAMEALKGRSARLVVSGSPSGVKAAVDGFEGLQATQLEPPMGVKRATLSKARRMMHKEALQLSQGTDNHAHLAVAWTLRGLAADIGMDVASRDAALLALRAWLGHPGGSLYLKAVEQHGALQELAVSLVERDAPVLVISGKMSAEGASDALREVMESLADVLEHHIEELSWGAKVASAELRSRFGDTVGRAQMIAELLSSGRAHDVSSAEAWLDAVLERLGAGAEREREAFVLAALIPERRLIVTAAPMQLPRTARLVLGAKTMKDYLRVLVDLQCPGPNFPASVAVLLREKYKITARHYADLTRAVARDRRLMRDLGEDAEFRCQELGRLRELMPAERVVKLHEAIACGPTAHPARKPGRKALARILKRFKVDRAWVRPLLGMAREFPATKVLLDEIDARCTPQGGG